MPSTRRRGRQPVRGYALSVEVMTIRSLLEETAGLAASSISEGISERPIGWSAGVDELRSGLGGPLPERPVDPREVVTELAAAVEPDL